MTPLRVTFVCHEYPPAAHGGVGTFDQALARALVRAGHAASVVGTYPGQTGTTTEDDHGVRVVRLAAGRTRSNTLAMVTSERRLWDAVAETDPHVVEGTELSFWRRPRSAPGAAVIRLQGGHHFFSAAAGTPPRRLRARLERLSFRRADAFVAVSEYVGRETARHLDLGGRPMAVLPNAIDVDRLAPDPDAEREPGLLVFAGTLCRKKGTIELVEAFGDLSRAHPMSRLVMIGRDTIDPDTGSSFRDGLVARLDASRRERVSFLGHQPHDVVAEHFRRAEVVVLPSHMETFGIVWAEAMAAGAALVASHAGPGPEVVADGVTGLLVDPHDPSAIGAAVDRLLADGGLAARLGEQAERAARERYAIDAVAADNVAFWRSVLDGS